MFDKCWEIFWVIYWMVRSFYECLHIFHSHNFPRAAIGAVSQEVMSSHIWPTGWRSTTINILFTHMGISFPSPIDCWMIGWPTWFYQYLQNQQKWIQLKILILNIATKEVSQHISVWKVLRWSFPISAIKLSVLKCLREEGGGKGEIFFISFFRLAGQSLTFSIFSLLKFKLP